MVRLLAFIGFTAALALVPRFALAQSSQDVVIYYHTDAIGSVRAITDATGGLLARYDFEPFGIQCGSACGTGLPPETIQFAGKERDADTQLDYLGGRYYETVSGRFTTVDPVLEIDNALVDPQRWNRYAYVRNNPLRYVDPDGRAIETVWDVISLGMSAKAVWQDPTSVWNWVSLGADVVSVLGPGIPAIGMAIRGGSKIDNAVDAARALEHANEATHLATVVSRTPTDRLLQHVTRDDLVGAAREVVTGVEHGGQHLKEVRQAARGLRERIKDINQGLSNPRLTHQRRLELERELGIASRHLDAAEQALQGRYLQHDYVP